MATTETSVLIVGAGPVGLALACELGLRGVDCVLIEKRDGTISVPKMSAVSARTMEFCRRWGIAEKVRTAVWSERHGMDFVYVADLRGRELARTRRPPLSEWGKLDFTPEGACHCPQIYFDPILAARQAALQHAARRVQPGRRNGPRPRDRPRRERDRDPGGTLSRRLRWAGR